MCLDYLSIFLGDCLIFFLPFVVVVAVLLFFNLVLSACEALFLDCLCFIQNFIELSFIGHREFFCSIK